MPLRRSTASVLRLDTLCKAIKELVSDHQRDNTLLMKLLMLSIHPKENQSQDA